MNIKKLTVNDRGYPEQLRDIPAPPDQIYTTGADLNALLGRPKLAIVGTRRMSPYGQQVTADFAAGLAREGVVIVSGLALGVDAAAHEAALEAGGLCIAVLPSPLDAIVPARNRSLARHIVERGGALVSEYAPGSQTFKQNFIERNRLMSGLADGVLITEAGLKSGTLHTANFAVEQGRDIFVVPGNIYAPGSAGTLNLLKQSQAAPVSSAIDVMEALGLGSPGGKSQRKPSGSNAAEQTVLDLMLEGISQGDQLLEKSRLGVSAFNRTLTMLEISGKVRALGANHWSAR